MFIESIELSDYRNYSHLHIDFHKGTNVLYGDNAQGKTNILEAVYVCSTTKSHRGSKDKEIIRFGADESHIKMMVRRDGIPYRIDMHLKKNKAKGVAVNGVPIKKASELFGIVNVIFFSPEDLNIIKNGPAERRRFVDLELCQLNRLYVYNLAQYNKTVIQRNKLLKDIDYNTSLKETLPMWNEQLLKYGTELIIMRSEFIKELNPLIASIHAGSVHELCCRPLCRGILSLGAFETVALLHGRSAPTKVEKLFLAGDLLENNGGDPDCSVRGDRRVIGICAAKNA